MLGMCKSIERSFKDFQGYTPKDIHAVYKSTDWRKCFFLGCEKCKTLSPQTTEGGLFLGSENDNDFHEDAKTWSPQTDENAFFFGCEKCKNIKSTDYGGGSFSRLRKWQLFSWKCKTLSPQTTERGLFLGSENDNYFHENAKH